MACPAQPCVVAVQPFLISSVKRSSEEEGFNVNKFYFICLLSPSLSPLFFCTSSHDKSDLLPFTTTSNEDGDNESFIPKSITISQIDDLLTHMHFHEVLKTLGTIWHRMEFGVRWV